MKALSKKKTPMRLLNLLDSAFTLLSSVNMYFWLLEMNRLSCACYPCIQCETEGYYSNSESCLVLSLMSGFDLRSNAVHSPFLSAYLTCLPCTLFWRHQNWLFLQQEAWSFEIKLCNVFLFPFSPLHLEQNLCTLPQACAICLTSSFSRPGTQTQQILCVLVCLCAWKHSFPWRQCIL